jgi:type III restriction enzyme
MDLIAKLDEGRGTAHLLNLIREVSGLRKKEKEAKGQTALTLWVSGVNILGTFGRWVFLESAGGSLHKTR